MVSNNYVLLCYIRHYMVISYTRNNLKSILADRFNWSTFRIPSELKEAGISRRRWYSLLKQELAMYAWEERIIRQHFGLEPDELIKQDDEGDDR